MKDKETIEIAFKLFSKAMLEYSPNSVDFNHCLSVASSLAWVLGIPQYTEVMDAIIVEMKRVLGNTAGMQEVIAQAEKKLRNRG